MTKVTKSIGYIAVIALLAVTSIISFNMFLRQRAEKDSLDIRKFPYAVGEWKGEELEVDERSYEILETRNLISRKYVNPSGESLYLFIIYSETNRAVFHPPEVCMIGSGVAIVDKQIADIESDKYKLSANKIYTQREDFKGMALYCYKAGNLYTDNFYLQQISFAFNQLLGSHKGGATIRVTTGIGSDEEKAFMTLKSFFKEVVEILEGM
ncbi:MAG: exosortase C-terminal domain/associated protein EpsI [Candidatus Omnitrophota bacterium]